MSPNRLTILHSCSIQVAGPVELHSPPTQQVANWAQLCMTLAHRCPPLTLPTTLTGVVCFFVQVAGVLIKRTLGGRQVTEWSLWLMVQLPPSMARVMLWPCDMRCMGEKDQVHNQGSSVDKMCCVSNNPMLLLKRRARGAPAPAP